MQTGAVHNDLAGDPRHPYLFAHSGPSELYGRDLSTFLQLDEQLS